MTTAVSHSGLSLETQVKYRDNFARHLLSVNTYLQSEIMKTLQEKHGHTALRMNFEPYIMIAGNAGARLSVIADSLGISRQAANHYANQIADAGYLQRRPDPTDGRAKLLAPTPKAKQLIRQGAREAVRLQHSFADRVGEEALRTGTRRICELNRALGLLLPFEHTQAGEPNLAAALPRLANHVTHRLQALTMARGHPGLKPSFGAVLAAIGPRGGRIQTMADNQAVSKQAISAIATELEQLGYIEPCPDPRDARQLIREQDFIEHLGKRGFSEMTDVLSRIYRALHLEEDVFESEDSDDIVVLARQLVKRLGDDSARALAQLILSGQPTTQPEQKP